MSELHAEALAPFDIQGRDLGVLLVIDRFEPASQQQVAQRLGVDRTTMVAIIDALEAKGIIARRPDAEDRRRNVVELTPAGQNILRQATAASDAAEAELLASLSPEEGEQLRDLSGAGPRQRLIGDLTGFGDGTSPPCIRCTARGSDPGRAILGGRDRDQAVVVSRAVCDRHGALNAQLRRGASGSRHRLQGGRDRGQRGKRFHRGLVQRGGARLEQAFDAVAGARLGKLGRSQYDVVACRNRQFDDGGGRHAGGKGGHALLGGQRFDRAVGAVGPIDAVRAVDSSRPIGPIDPVGTVWPVRAVGALGSFSAICAVGSVGPTGTGDAYRSGRATAAVGAGETPAG